MIGRLQNKVALVTGASRGIGRAAALALAREGCDVVGIARSKPELDSLVQEIQALGRRGLAVVGDVTVEADVERLKKEALATFGRVDILVNNVGVGKYATLDKLSAKDYDWMMNTNMRSMFLCTKAFAPQMVERKQGSIVFVGSQAGLQGFPGESVYCATKFAQHGFAQAVDAEVREHGVKVSIVAPGGVKTYFAFGTGRTQGDPELDTYLEAEDVADAIVFAATQGAKSRTLLISMRPMVE